VTVKEIVDGQQRIRSIVEFASDEFALNKKSETYQGKYYKDLTQDEQEQFLGYAITAEQFLNATDDDVIDIFARLNSYTVSLNAAEKRHAAFQTELKFFVRKMSIKHRWFIEKYNVFTIKQRFRMADDEFFAELTRMILNGLCDGGAEKVTKFYKATKDSLFTEEVQRKTESKLDELLTFLDLNLSPVLKGLLGKHYQIYSLCSAYLYIKKLIPEIDDITAPSQLRNPAEILNNLSILEIELDDDTSNTEFCKASRSSTQRISNRLARLRTYLDAMGV
jgi:hypothetical protein